MQGEQILNKDAQTQKALRVINGLSDYKTIYKSLRPKQVVNSVLRVTKDMVCLKTNIPICFVWALIKID